MPPLNYSPEVYEMLEDFQFQITNKDGRGRRVYLDATNTTLPDGTKTTLPAIGSSWDADYSYCTCKSITIKYIANNDNCPVKYICEYDGMPYLDALTSPTECP